MIINKNNILTYLKIIKESRNRGEIFVYIFKRMRGIKTKFNQEVIIKNKGILLNCGKYMENCTVACSQFEKELAGEIDLLKTGIFVDVGAHIGKHSITVAKKLAGNGKVISIEANKDSANLLRKNIALNNLRNVEVHEVACCDKNGSTYFYKSEYHPATNSLSPIHDSQKIKLKTQTLDSIIGNRKDVRFIKIDVEGAEDKVLEGAKKTITNSYPQILFEAWNGQNLRKVANILKKYGYQIKKIDEYNYLASI